IMPRDVQLNLPEFATQAAIDYFVTKKETNVGKFSDLLAQSDAYIARANQELAQLATLLSPSSHYLNGTDLSLEDIIIFPLLRNLSMVRDVDYPAIVRDYVDFMAQESQINLYFDRAI
ncbi:glutaredoxin, partial [Kingella kingae]|nr:glutaredoxin [Kingella kingae]